MQGWCDLLWWEMWPTSTWTKDCKRTEGNRDENKSPARNLNHSLNKWDSERERESKRECALQMTHTTGSHLSHYFILPTETEMDKSSVCFWAYFFECILCRSSWSKLKLCRWLWLDFSFSAGYRCWISSYLHSPFHQRSESILCFLSPSPTSYCASLLSISCRWALVFCATIVKCQKVALVSWSLSLFVRYLCIFHRLLTASFSSVSAPRSLRPHPLCVHVCGHLCASFN